MHREMDLEFAIDGTAEPDLRCSIAEAYRELGRHGLNSGSSGNISCRVEERILITATGTRWNSITADSVVSMSLDGQFRNMATPSCEWQMHVEIYRRRPEALAIVHTHSDACVALSCLRRPIPAFHYMVAAFGGSDVPCTPYAPFGSQQLACAAAGELAGRTACLLANHGMVCHSTSLSGAVFTAVALETLARQYLMALQAGDPVLLTSAEVSAAGEQLRSYGCVR
jgi:L-fuculose-phosphate aldolase